MMGLFSSSDAKAARNDAQADRLAARGKIQRAIAAANRADDAREKAAAKADKGNRR